MSDQFTAQIPNRLPRVTRRVINASRVLTDGQKRVWIEDQELDCGIEGSFLEHAVIAARLGYTSDSVKNIRSQLVAMGLQVTFPRPGMAKFTSRRCTLAAKLVPADRPSPKEIELLVVELDSALRTGELIRMGW